RAKTRIGDDFPRGCIYIFAGGSGLRRRKSCRLGLLLQLPDLPLSFGRFRAEHDTAADIGTIAVDLAAIIHQDDIAFIQMLGLDAAMRESLSLPEICAKVAAHTQA